MNIDDDSHTITPESNKKIKQHITQMLSVVLEELLASQQFEYAEKNPDYLKETIKIAFSMYIEYLGTTLESIEKRQIIAANTNALFANYIALDMEYIYSSKSPKKLAKKYVENVREYHNRQAEAYNHRDEKRMIDFDLSVHSWNDDLGVGSIEKDSTLRGFYGHLISGNYPNPTLVEYKYDEEKGLFIQYALYWMTFYMITFAISYGGVTGIDIDQLDELGQLLSE